MESTKCPFYLRCAWVRTTGGRRRKIIIFHWWVSDHLFITIVCALQGTNQHQSAGAANAVGHANNEHEWHLALIFVIIEFVSELRKTADRGRGYRFLVTLFNRRQFGVGLDSGDLYLSRPEASPFTLFLIGTNRRHSNLLSLGRSTHRTTLQWKSN